MAIIQALLLALSRRAGQLVNTVFGWATALLFGKVPQDKQIYISIMTFGSVAWLIAVIGIAFPAVGTFLLSAIPLPDWVDRTWVRWAMFALALLLPPVVGLLGAYAVDEDERPKENKNYLKNALRGYPYTLALAVTLVLMIVLAPFLMIPRIIKRWKTEHVPVLVEADEYDAVVEEIDTVMASAGWQTERHPANWMIRVPTQILTRLAGDVVDNYVAENLTTLNADEIEVTLHPADLVISGEEHHVAHLRALIAEQMAFSKANMTWTKEAVEMENAVSQMWRDLRSGDADPHNILAQLREQEKQRNELQIAFEEWEVLERQQLLVERAVLKALAHDEPLQDAGEKAAAEGKEPSEVNRERFAKKGMNHSRLVSEPT
ncbi:MAG: hypothetical protein OHK0029_36870 [Armatimonadaceae bacterium]